MQHGWESDAEVVEEKREKIGHDKVFYCILNCLLR